MADKNNLENVQKLREITKAGVMDIKKALDEAGHDFDKALAILQARGAEIAAKKSEREIKQGLIGSYIHMGGVAGALVEIGCETDFVARTDEFKELVNDIAVHVTGMNPKHIAREDIPQEILKEHKNDLEDYTKESCLLEQAFIKRPEITIREYIQEKIGEIGENIRVTRFERYQIGE